MGDVFNCYLSRLIQVSVAVLLLAGGGILFADEPKFGIQPIPPQKIFAGPASEPQPLVTNETTGAALVMGVDYELEYENNTSPGKANLKVVGKGTYSGQILFAEFDIVKVCPPAFVAASYIQDGLIVQLDGIDNAGTGAHDPASTTWVDLQGNLNFPLASGGSWEDKCFKHSGFSAQATASIPSYRTVEAVFKLSGDANGYIFYTHTRDRVIFRHKDSSALWFESTQGVAAAIPMATYSALQHVAATYSGATVTAAYRDAEQVAVQNTASVWNISGTKPTIGSRGNKQYGTNGRIYALRFYSRELTQEEIRYNYTVDRARFFDDRSVLCEMGVAPIPDQYAVGTIDARPEPVVTNKTTGATLAKGVDYDVAWSNNTAVGTAYAIVTGMGDYTNTSTTVSFEICRPEFCDFVVDPVDNQLYDGVHAVEPELSVHAKADGSPLVRGVDYDLVYTNNNAVGVATATVVGKGEHAGMFYPVEFNISAPKYAAATARGTGDGSSWANAMSFTYALATVSQDESVCVMAGTIPLTAGISVSVPFRMYGGYRGDPADPLAKDAGARTVIAGGGTVQTLLTLGANTSVDDSSTVVGFVFTGAQKRGFVKSGAAGLLMEDCDFTFNGMGDSGYTDGRGAKLSGAALTSATLRNCRFRYNMATNNAAGFGNGVGLNVGTFSRVRLENCSFVGNGLSHRLRGGLTQEVLYGAALYSTSPIVAVGCEFRVNNAAERNDKRGGTVCLAGGSGHVFSNCTFVANSGTFMQYEGTTGGGVVRVAVGSGKTVRFERCTFAYNLTDSASGANLNIVSGSVVVRNCVFSGAFASYRYTGGKYVHVYSGAKCSITDTMFPSGSEGDAVRSVRDFDLVVGKNVTYGDAHFATTPETVEAWTVTASGGTLYFDPAKTNELEGIDVHLVCAGAVYSAAIDQGAEEDAVGGEPAPNGGRLNLGAYAGTAEAAMSDPDAAVVDSFAVSWPDGLSMPKFHIGLGGAEGALYNADVEFFCATGAQVTAQEFVPAGRVYGLHCGGEAECQYALPLVPGDSYMMRAVVCNGSLRVTNDIVGTVQGDLPPWYGKGGGAGVMHVWPGAVYDSTGGDWSHAFRTFAEAVAAWDSSKTEIWIAGTNVVSSSPASFAPTASVALRGGFTGVENTAAERPSGAYARLDGQDTATTIFTLANAASATVSVERVEFYRGYVRGLRKSGAGRLVLDDCRFLNNARNTCNNTGGYGAWITGAAGAAAVVTNCWFEGQTYNSNCSQQNNGRALLAQTFSSLEIVDSTFVCNGAGLAGDLGSDSPNKNSNGTTLCVENAPTTLRGCDFSANRGTVGGSSKNCGGVVSIGGASGGTLVENCLFAGNSDTLGGAANTQTTYSGSGGGALVFRLAAMDTKATVKNCTFAFNLADAVSSAAALTVQTGDVDVKNCIFHGNRVGGGTLVAADIAFAASATGSVSFSMFDADFATSISSDGSAPALDESTCRIGDPLFAVTNDMASLAVFGGLSYFRQTQATLNALLALDAHLRSTKGYWLNDGTMVTNDTVLSSAIDGGDPSDGFDREPHPNGYRVNLGRYGNTGAASQTPAGQPTVESVSVEFADGWSQPSVSVLLGGSGESYSATVGVTLLTNGVAFASADIPGIALGGTATYRPPVYLQPGDTLVVKVVVTASDATPVLPDDVVMTVDAELPPWYGKGGDPARVVHVRPGATGTGDGSSWSDACTDFVLAMGKTTDERCEVWICGDVSMTSTMTLNGQFSLRGGFDGSENSPEERRAGAMSWLNGQSVAEELFLANNPSGTTVTMDGLALVRAHTRAVSKTSGAGDLVLTGCLVASNGLSVCNDGGGHGIKVVGAGAARLVVSNCVFRDQSFGAQCQHSNDGGAINAASFSRIEIVGSSFVNNGATATSSVGANHPYRKASGRAIYVSNSPLVMSGCSVVANYGTAGHPNDPLSGGTVTLVGACGGSVIRNCRFLGNSNDFGEAGGGQLSNSTFGGGALVLRLSDSTHTAAVENCTFAWNVSDTYLSAAGLSVASGYARVRNCLFANNRTGAYTAVAKHVSFADDASGDLSYSLFDAPLADSVSVSGSSATVATNTIVVGDARLVSSERMSDLLTTGSLTYFKRTAGIRDRLEALDCHLRSNIGYVDGSTGAVVRFLHERSPAIDAGDPSSDWSHEPDLQFGSNGGRVNLGAYGNTPEAALSPLSGTFFYVK